VNEFVEECRREWRRLRVPEPVANEMAADLAADLEEAQAEGVSPEEVLGSGAFDPRSFAASWAAERGVSRPSRTRARVPRRSFILFAIAALVAIALSGVALAIFASPSGSEVAPAIFAARPPRLHLPATPHDLRPLTVIPRDGQAGGAGIDTRAIGLVLLIVGLAGAVVLALFWLWLGRGSRRRTYIDDRPTGSAY
jgi:hypothetical protein